MPKDAEDLSAKADAVQAQKIEDPIAALAAATGVTDVATLKAILEAATASIQGSHKAEIEALRQEMHATASGHEGKVQDGNESMGGYPYMYYRIGPTFPDAARRGWLTVGPGGANTAGQRDAGSYNTYLRKGFIPIMKYGKCPVPTSPVAARSFDSLVKNGGAVEFPASQIISYQWHRNNPYAALGIRFPQLTPELLASLESFTCEYCGFEMDFMPGDKLAGTAYRLHLVNSDRVTFKEAIEAVKAAGLTTTPFRRVVGAGDARRLDRPD